MDGYFWLFGYAKAPQQIIFDIHDVAKITNSAYQNPLCGGVSLVLALVWAYSFLREPPSLEGETAVYTFPHSLGGVNPNAIKYFISQSGFACCQWLMISASDIFNTWMLESQDHVLPASFWNSTGRILDFGTFFSPHFLIFCQFYCWQLILNTYIHSMS